MKKANKAKIEQLIDFSLFAEQVGGYSDVEEENEVINKIAVNIIEYLGKDVVIDTYRYGFYKDCVPNDMVDIAEKWEIAKNTLIRVIRQRIR